MSRLIFGVGVNDANYVTQINENFGYLDGKQIQKKLWTCPFYVVWVSMLRRCYSNKYKERFKTYKACVVCDEWLYFMTFRAWMETQDWEGNQLDKDLLTEGNKLYSPETCVFVSGIVNNFILETDAGRGQYMIGVCWHKCTSKFISSCRNPIIKKREHLGLFDSELDAHQAWLKRKLEHAYALAATQTDERVAKALIDRYENYNL